MENAGINSDQNFYSRRQYFPDDEERPQFYNNSPQLPSYDRPPQLPPKDPITSGNLQATTLNGYVAGGPATVGDSPDDFYRGYRGLQSTTNYNDFNMTNGNTSGMVGARQPPSFFRSNGNGTTPRHPTITTPRNAPKPSYRSASAPVDNGLPLNSAKSNPAMNAYPSSQQPSVKDLLKRFDQQNSTQPIPVVRKPANRTVPQGHVATGPGYLRTRTPGEARRSPVSHRPGQMTRDVDTNNPSQAATRHTQRDKFMTEDQHSNNTLSSVARSRRQRNEVSRNTGASRSMTNLSPSFPPTSSAKEPFRKPLFGELDPADSGQSDLGYGIAEVQRRRRTSDSSLHPPQRSDDVFSPSSPTSWYLGAAPHGDDTNTQKSPRVSPKHNRAHSDLAGGSSNPLNGSTSTASEFPKATSQSRLPVNSRRPSDPSSPISTRSTSPLALKTYSSSAPKSRKPDLRSFSTSAPASTPPQRILGRASASPPKLSNNNSSLNAYISAPLPKTSPPLRSSRPRLPVSAASTTSSRGKITARSNSPQQSNATRHPRRLARENRGDPIDFAARRAKIREAYTKSMEDSVQNEPRTAGLGLEEEESRKEAALPVNEGVANIEDKSTARLPEPTLMIDTSFLSPRKPISTTHRARDSDGADSPTLGMPGSFPITREDNDVSNIPLSAVSNTTEIDNEAQTETPGRGSREIPEFPMPGSLAPYPQRREPSTDSSIHTGTSTDNESVQIILDTSSIEIPVSHEPENAPKSEDSSYAEQEQYLSNHVYDPHSAPVASDSAIPHQYTVDREPERVNLQIDLGHDELFPQDEGEEITDMVEPQLHAAKVSSWDQTQQEPKKVYGTSPMMQLPAINTGLKVPFPVQRGLRADYLETPVTEIDYESSDGMPETMDGHYLSSVLPKSQRISQQSTWTDYTVNTNDGSSWRDDIPTGSDGDQVPPLPPKERPPLTAPEVPPKPPSYSPQPSPRAGSNSGIASSVHSFERKHSVTQETRDPSLSSKSTTSISLTPAWPDYSPPPPPQQFDTPTVTSNRTPPPPNFYNRRPVSTSYRSSHKDPESRRASGDDFNSSRPSISTRRSSTQVSDSETPGHSLMDEQFKEDPQDVGEVSEAAEKAKIRLRQRQMTIKELIDTESVYLKDMNVVEEIYKGTAEACPKLEPGDIQTIFRNTAEIIAFSTTFLHDLKIASAAIYSPRSKARQSKITAASNSTGVEDTNSTTAAEESDLAKDRKTFIGASFGAHLKNMQTVYTDFLKTSEQASNRLLTLQADGTVKVWLGECNTVAKDLTAAWDLDALLVKPVQRITRYQLLLAQILEKTPEDHPDYEALRNAREGISNLLTSIDDMKKRIDTVSKIVSRKRKESDVRLGRTGLAKAFARRDKVQSSSNRPPEDEVYQKHHEKFNVDFMNIQVIMRDVEFYTRQVAVFVNDFLRYLAAVELSVTVSGATGSYPELVSKWRRFNLSMRDMGTIALEDHVSSIRKRVIEPMEQVIKAHQPPEMAVKKRNKRRLDYEKWLSLKSQNKKIDDKLTEQVVQYEALNETLKLELPKLEHLTNKVVNLCLQQYISILTQWYAIWQEKVKIVLEESQMPKDIDDIVDKFHRDFKFQLSLAQDLSIINGSFLANAPKGRNSQSTKDDDSSTKSRSRPPALDGRFNGYSVNGDPSPSIPTPDFVKSNSGQFTFSPIMNDSPGLLQFNSMDFPSPNGQVRTDSGSGTPDTASSSKPYYARPSTGRSLESGGIPRKSVESGEAARSPPGSGYYYTSPHVDGPPLSARPFSGLFNSAMPVPDDTDESRRSSRASSRERDRSSGYNVLYLAASLFEFNISATKTEAGYPYLTYQAGEIFDVIGEKGELWLAKNQDDLSDCVGWIWSKHFARLATD